MTAITVTLEILHQNLSSSVLSTALLRNKKNYVITITLFCIKLKITKLTSLVQDLVKCKTNDLTSNLITKYQTSGYTPIVVKCQKPVRKCQTLDTGANICSFPYLFCCPLLKVARLTQQFSLFNQGIPPLYQQWALLNSLRYVIRVFIVIEVKFAFDWTVTDYNFMRRGLGQSLNLRGT